MQKWESFLDSSPLVAEAKMINAEREFVKFKLTDEASYMKFREIVQILDSIMLNIEHRQYNPRMLTVSLLYLILGREFGQFKQEKIVEEMPYSSIFLYEDRQGFHKIFSSFVKPLLNMDLTELLPVIQYSAKYFELPLDFDLPIAVKKNAESIMQVILIP